jgi:hypothetical protein
MRGTSSSSPVPKAQSVNFGVAFCYGRRLRFGSKDPSTGRPAPALPAGSDYRQRNVGSGSDTMWEVPGEPAGDTRWQR